MYRRIQLIGNVGKDPEIKNTQNGQVANFSIAVNENWRDRQSGEKKQRTTWFRIVAFQRGDSGLVTSLIQPFVTKGQLVFIDGTPTIRSWEDQGGKTNWAFEVQLDMNSTLKLLGGNGEKRREPGDDREEDHGSPGTGNGRSTRPAADLDDDIPF